MTVKWVFFNFPLTYYSLVWSSRMELFFVFLRFKINPCEVICSKAYKNGPGKICGRQHLKNLKWYGLPQKTILADHITSNFLKTVFHRFYLARFWIPFPISSRYLWAYCSRSGINQTHRLIIQAFLIIQALKSQKLSWWRQFLEKSWTWRWRTPFYCVCWNTENAYPWFLSV